MTRQHRSMTEEAADALERHREDGESFSQFALRIAAILDEGDGGMDVTEPLRSDGIPEDVLTTDHISDISTETARKAADELENRLR